MGLAQAAMTDLRTGTQYIEAIRDDGRHVVHDGEVIRDVTRHPAFAGVVAGVTAYASIAFLMRYFRRHDFEALDPFAYYCWAFGLLALGLLLFVV